MITGFFNSTAEVKQEVKTTTGMNSIRRDYTTRIAALKCRLSIRHGQDDVVETDDFGKRTVWKVWRLYCSATTEALAITETDRIEVGNKKFEVTGIYNPAVLNRHLQIDLLEVR
jgi:Na+-transporting NADH:ubiquinone oxidoreductase subunit NqrF